MENHRCHRMFEWAGIVAWATMGGLLAHRVLASAWSADAWLTIATAGIASLFLSDLTSGVVHWAFDRYGAVDTPVLGPGFIHPFREHHDVPTAICGHDFVETNGNSCIVAILPIGLGLWLDPAAHLGLSATLLGVAMGVFATNQVHSWAHAHAPPRVALWLQRAGLILRPEHHARHHSGEFDTHYCITSGWMNGVLARSQLFERIERVLPPSVQAGSATATIATHTPRGSHAPVVQFVADPEPGLHARGRQVHTRLRG
jgi:ubiquitin-conjugating enzyme E2 variant